MPCRDHRSDESLARSAGEMKRQLDVRTAQMCRAMNVLEENDLLEESHITPRMRAWWAAHKQRDAAARLEERKRKKREAKQWELRKKGLSKLSNAEREALGL